MVAASKVAAGSADKMVYIWDAEQGKILYKLPGHTACVNDVDLHPFQPIIGSCSSDKKIFLGEIESE
jgi:Prp8 binding protein